MRQSMPLLLALVPLALAGCPERPGVKKDDKPAAKREAKAAEKAGAKGGK